MTRVLQSFPMPRSPGARSYALVVAVMLASAPAAALPEGPAGYSLEDGETGEYTVACHVAAEKRWTEASDVRVAFDVLGADDFAYVQVHRGRASLFASSGGTVQPVDPPRPFQPPDSWEAFLQRRDGRVRFIAAGRVLLDAPWDRPAGGRAGVMASGDLRIANLLVQPYAPPVLFDDFTREAGETGGWEVHSPSWRNTLVPAPKADPSRSANPFTIRAEAKPEALTSTGDWFWDSYQASVSVKPLSASAVGIAVYVQDDENMIQLRWEAGPPDQPRAKQLILLRNGKATVLAADSGGFAQDQWYRLGLRAQPGSVEAFVDRHSVLSATTDAFGQGAVGLWCGEGEAVFDDMTAAPADSSIWALPRINPVFLADEVMSDNQLYLPAGQWHRGQDGVYWNWGEYFDDVALRVPVSALSADPLAVLLRADGAGKAYTVSLSSEGGALESAVSRPEGATSSGSCEIGQDEVVTVSVGGDAVSVTCGERRVTDLRDPDALRGRKLGLQGAADKVLGQATVTSDHQLDCAFDTAPTDWYSGKGIWQITTRWPCQPGWTFFGGTHQENPVLWTKHTYHGDVVLEFFANLQMDLPPPPGYAHPSDINAALCADGAELGSGYGFIFAGWNNTKTAILRCGAIVAETNEAVFVNPTSSNAAFHRHWFRVRAERLGNRVALWVDGRRVLEYEDPDPLPEGRAAVWSFHNGIMIGRAKLWFAEERRGDIVPSHLEAVAAPDPVVRSAESAVSDDFETGPGEWQTYTTPPTVGLELDRTTSASGKRSLRVTNLASGGAFGTYAVVTPFRASDFPQLSFDYRIPAGVEENIYLYANRQWHAIQLCAEEPESASTPLLGRIEGVQCDDQWHHAEFDLLGPLQALYPELKTHTVRYVALAAPEESYVRCGIGANRQGAAYWLDNFRIGPAGG